MTDQDAIVTSPAKVGMATNIILTAAGNVIAPFSAFAGGVIVAHTLGVDGQGRLSGAVAPLLLAVAAATFGLPEAVTWIAARNPHIIRPTVVSAGRMVISASVALALALTLLAPVLSNGSEDLDRLIILAAWALPLTAAMATLRGAAAGLHLWRAVMIERIVSSLARFIGIATLALAGNLTPLTATVVVAYAPTLGLLVYVGRTRRWPGGSATHPEQASVISRTIVSYAGRVWLGSLSGIVLLRVDQLLMTPLAGSRELGLYSVAASISEVPLVFNASVREVSFATEAAVPDADRLTRASRLSTLVVAGAAIAIASCLWWVVPISFGRDFKAAVVVTWILLVGVVGGNTGSVAAAGLSARGNPGLRSLALALACAVNVLLVFALVPPFGAIGAAFATVAGNVTAAQLAIFFLWKRHSIHPGRFFLYSRDDIRYLARRFARRGRPIETAR